MLDILNISQSIIIPLALNRITYQHEFEEIKYFTKVDYFVIHKFSPIEIIRFIGTLDPNESYITTIDLIPEISQYDDSEPRIFISEPFLINKNISASLLGNFIFNNEGVKAARACNLQTVLVINFSKVVDYK
jgi:hypothetical protein